VLLVERPRLGLRDLPRPGRDEGRPEPFAPQHRRVVEIDELRVVRELQLGESER